MNHVSFIDVSKTSEEDDTDPMKETYSFKEAMISPHEKEFVEATMKEMKNHAERNHCACCQKSSVPYSQILRPTWTFKTKRDRSIGEVLKHEASSCAD